MWRGLVWMGIAAMVATGCEDDGPVPPWNDPVTGGGGTGGLGSATGEGSATGQGSATGEAGAGGGGEPQTCTLNCCDGALLTLSSPFAKAEDCETTAMSTAGCELHGGAANVMLGATIVWQDLSCDGNCHVNCCNGKAAFSTTSNKDQCEEVALGACGEITGGPSTVAFDNILAWTAQASCPSLRPCTLRCGDGTETTMLHYQAALCVNESVESTSCEGHGGPKSVSFSGQQVWP